MSQGESREQHKARLRELQTARAERALTEAELWEVAERCAAIGDTRNAKAAEAQAQTLKGIRERARAGQTDAGASSDPHPLPSPSVPAADAPQPAAAGGCGGCSAFILGLCLLVLLSYATGTPKDRRDMWKIFTERTSTDVSVSYRLTGSATRADVTYESGDGGAGQRTVPVPSTLGPFNMRLGDHAYISGQITDRRGGSLKVEVLISQEGSGSRVEYHGEAVGFPNIASASGLVRR